MQRVESGTINLYFYIKQATTMNSLNPVIKTPNGLTYIGNMNYGGSLPGIAAIQKVIKFYACKNNTDKVVEVKSNSGFNKTTRKERKEALFNLLADKPQLLEDFKEKDYSFAEIQAIVHLYNTGQPLPEKTEETEDSGN